jgi:hypothetical protein
MYQHMQESLEAHLNDTTLPPRMHSAIKVALAKLTRYYDMAKLNHFNILATSKYFRLSMLTIISKPASNSSPSGSAALMVQVHQQRLL